jgi:CheY-like chemotaxis protein
MKTEKDDSGKKRILLVDDERLLRETVRRVLAKDNHVVVEANNGAEAYNLFTQSKFDLVLTDWIMPFLKGDELAQRIKLLVPEQPILMVTGHRFRRGPRTPVDAVIDKPFDINQLREEISKLLQLPVQSPITTALV